MSERAQQILTIVTKSGLRRWRYLPMGPNQGPGICQGFNDAVFGDLECTNIFVDDFHTGTLSFEEHLDTLKELLSRGRARGVQWRATKCHFCHAKVVLIGFEVSVEGRRPDPKKVEALKQWPKEESLADVCSLFHFANYLREFIPGFLEHTKALKPYRAKGAKWEAYLCDKEAQQASEWLRQAVATKAPLVNPDFKAAANYLTSGRPFLLFIDASDYGYGAVLAQAPAVHGTPRPIAVLSKSFDETQQRWTPMEREMHAMYEASVWSQKFCKSFKTFVLTDHTHNTFRTKIQPTRRVSKKLRKMAIEMEPMLLGRLYIAGDDTILGDTLSRNPHDKAIAKNLPIPLQPIKDTIWKMFWAPDELDGEHPEEAGGAQDR